MRQKKSWFIVGVTLAVIAVALVLAPGAWAASTFKVLHRFTGGFIGGTDAAQPEAGLIFDAAGNVYGVTVAGGASTNCPSSNTGCGVVFKLTPNSNGSWTERVIHSFCSVPNCADGGGPIAGLIFDAAGNLYGTAAGAGS